MSSKVSGTSLAAAAILAIAGAGMLYMYMTKLRAREEAFWAYRCSAPQGLQPGLFDANVLKNSFELIPIPKTFEGLANQVVAPSVVATYYGGRLGQFVGKGKFLLMSDFDTLANDALAEDLKDKTNANRRAFSLPIRSLDAVAGMIKPRDRVDVWATLQYAPGLGETGYQRVTIVLLEDLEVVAVGKNLMASSAAADQPRAPATFDSVTFLLDSRQIAILLHAKEAASAQFTLALRPPPSEDTPRTAESIEDAGNDFWEFVRRRMEAASKSGIGSGRSQRGG